ncbi:MAG: polysaccharide pyruvyl transferase family protein [Rariglobus sp.]
MPNPARPLRILLRSAWQTVNIGDIGHTPGILSLFAQYLPEAEITLWPKSVDRGVRQQLLAAFPQLRIAEGELDGDGLPDSDSVREAFARCDVMVHGSGPSLLAIRHLEAWSRLTGKPYGVCGVTCDPTAFGATGSWEGGTLDAMRTTLMALPPGRFSSHDEAVLRGAGFLFFRDTLSLDYVNRQLPGLRHIVFGADATFACDLRDESKAESFLRAHGLERDRFICVIPRLRWTPYHLMNARTPNESDHARDAVNARTRSSDHAALREMIIRFVRHTGLSVLACPEMTYQVELAREQLVDPLPDDVRPHVIWKDSYWLNDEASSVYARALAVVSVENHSPILALAQGTPAIFLRQPTDTVKGQMWPDLGLGDWFFEIEHATGDALWDRLRTIHFDLPAARARARRLHETALRSDREMMAAVASAASNLTN